MSVFSNETLLSLLISIPSGSYVTEIAGDHLVCRLPTTEDMVVEFDAEAMPKAIKFFCLGNSTISRPSHMGPAMVTFYVGTTRPASILYIENGSLNRDPSEGPAYIKIDEAGEISFFGYYLDGNEVKGDMNVKKKLKIFVDNMFLPESFIRKIPVFAVNERMPDGTQMFMDFMTSSEFADLKNKNPDKKYFIVDFRRAILDGKKKILI